MLSHDGQPFAMELPLTSPTRCELLPVMFFLLPRALPPLTFIVSYAKSMVHSVGTSKMCKSRSKSSCTDVQTFMTNSVLVGLRFWLKQLQKWSKKCFKIGMWTVSELCERVPEVCKSGAICAMWQESSVTRVHEKCHSACKSASIATVIMSKNS